MVELIAIELKNQFRGITVPSDYSYKEGDFLDLVYAEQVLKFIEKIGMVPPALSGAKCKALAHVYLYPDYNLWDEDFEKDKKAVDAYNYLSKNVKSKKRRSCA